MHLLIYPGIHDSALTQQFVSSLLAALPMTPQQYWVIPAGGSALCGLSGLMAVLTDVGPASEVKASEVKASKTKISDRGALSILAFSAGVVGASQMIPAWTRLGGKINCFIAIDGWGVPLGGDFPLIRLSHDWFTCWSSAYLSAPHTQHFYADPAVSHLALWTHPQFAPGQTVQQTNGYSSECSPIKDFDRPPGKSRLTALEMICQTLTASQAPIPQWR